MVPDDPEQPPAVTPTQAANGFRAFADDFSAISRDGATTKTEVSGYRLAKKLEGAAYLLAFCARNGWFAGIPGMAELVEWLDKKADPKKTPIMNRSLVGFFIEVCGGNQVGKRLSGTGYILLNLPPIPGLLPVKFPAAFTHGVCGGAQYTDEFRDYALKETYAHWAQSCRLLADLVTTNGVALAGGVAGGGERAVDEGAGNTDGMDGEAKVLALLVQHPDWTDKHLAEAAGVNRTSLYRMERFTQAKAVMRGQANGNYRQRQDTKQGIGEDDSE